MKKNVIVGALIVSAVVLWLMGSSIKRRAPIEPIIVQSGRIEVLP